MQGVFVAVERGGLNLFRRIFRIVMRYETLKVQEVTVEGDMAAMALVESKADKR